MQLQELNTIKMKKTKQDIIDSLDWLYDNAYHEGLPELGNWWQWELGIPKKSK